MEPENEPLEEEYPLGTIIFRFHVSFRGCNPFIKKSRQVFVWPTQEDGFSVVFLHIFFGEIWMPSLIWFSFQLDIFLVQKASTILEIPSSNLTQHFGLSLWVFADSPCIECFCRFLSESFGLAFVANLSKRKNVPRSFERVFSSGSIGTRAIQQPPKNPGFFSSFLGIPRWVFRLPHPSGKKKRQRNMSCFRRTIPGATAFRCFFFVRNFPSSMWEDQKNDG